MRDKYYAKVHILGTEGEDDNVDLTVLAELWFAAISKDGLNCPVLKGRDLITGTKLYSPYFDANYSLEYNIEKGYAKGKKFLFFFEHIIEPKEMLAILSEMKPKEIEDYCHKIENIQRIYEEKKREIKDRKKEENKSKRETKVALRSLRLKKYCSKQSKLWW